MNTKAQLFSVDFIFSIILVVLAVGTILNVAELRAFSGMQDAKAYKLKAVGDIASDLLVNNEDSICMLYKSPPQPSELGSLPNCFSAQGSNISKSSLGLASDYECRLSVELIQGYTYGTQPDLAAFRNRFGCTSTLPLSPARSVYSSKRQVVIRDTSDPGNPRRVPQADLSSCMSGGSCPLVPYYLVLEVWEA